MKIRALIVDDSRVMRNMVMQSLKSSGLADFQFIEAEDGEDALEAFEHNMDILFVDWNMPKMTGIEFVRKVRKLGKTEHIKIIMVTSERSVGKIEEALDTAGANAFITKPFTVDVLKRQLEPFLEEIAASRASAPKSGGFFSKLLGS
jgi:two-component system, chemotaxis family, chemotaxis protein CheY